jgi:hypothetical protein
MLPIDIIEAVCASYEKTTSHTVRRLDEILAEKLDNVRNFKSHAAKMQNDFSISITADIPVDEFSRVKMLRNSILRHYVIVTLLQDYYHDYQNFLQRTFGSLCNYLNLHLPNAELHDADTKAHGLSAQQKDRSEDDILLSMNATQITAYLAATKEAKK